MKAMQYQGYNHSVRLVRADIPMPSPGPEQLLVEVAATAINPIDWKLRSGVLRWAARGRIASVPCFDFAGTVAGTGHNVDRFRPGERVFGMLPATASGAAAEYVVVDQNLVAGLPAELDFQAAAGMPLAGLTALQGLRDDGRLKAKKRLLVIGASGGVGHFAVQIGKALDAHVTGVCSTGNVELVRGLGADEVIDYTRGIPADTGEAFDVILDAVISRPFRDWRRLLGPEGVYVALLPAADRLWNALLFRLASKRRIRFTMVKPNGEDLDYLAGLAQTGRLRTVIDGSYPLDRLEEAMQRSRSGQTRGKIIVAVREGARQAGGTHEGR